MKLSIVCTVYKSESIINELVERISVEALKISPEFEIVLVDDASPDNSWYTIENICSKNSFVKGVKLSRNFGQQIAISAGMRYAKGDIVIIMDGDLQNPPSAIPLLVTKINEGNDIVYTTSKIRNHWHDELSSSLFWFIMNSILKVGIIPNQLMMKAFNRNFLTIYNGYDERIRVVAGITHDIGMIHAIVEVENKRRTSGKGNYGFFKRFHLMLDIIMAMTNQPLNYLINFSIVALFISITVGAWSLFNYIKYPNVPPGYTSLLVFISFFGSLTLLLLGIIGRYLSNIYMEVRHRPMFTIKKSINIKDE